MQILAIESSCDETGIAVIDNGRLIHQALYSQEALHQKIGGVIPELAAREHMAKIHQLLKTIQFSTIDRIAVTVGPGLVGSLLVGIETARTLGYLLDKPVMAINHLEGHVFSAFAEKISHSEFLIAKHLPLLCLVVSGGHTELVLVKKLGHYQVIGRTVDDAAGEAFDKIGRLLGLGYPGGPAIAAEAAKWQMANGKWQISLPRPMLNDDSYNFSFSGLKTAVLYSWEKLSKSEQRRQRAAYAAEAQQAIVDVLVAKTVRAVTAYRPKTVTIGGGVAANQLLRRRMRRRIDGRAVHYLEPNIALATDNAAMIAVAAWLLRNQHNRVGRWQELSVDPGLSLD